MAANIFKFNMTMGNKMIFKLPNHEFIDSRTIKALHLGLLSILAFLHSFGIASLLAVEHEPQDHNDISHSSSHRQTDCLDHLVGSLILLFTGERPWFVCLAQGKMSTE